MALTTVVRVQMDRSFIKRRWSFNKTPLGRAGAYIMKIARTSIRRRKNRNLHSRPGTPPYSHVPGATPPFKMVRFDVDTLGWRVFVGMIGFNLAGPPVPGLQEHGGGAVRKQFRIVGRRTLKRAFRTPRMGGLIRKKVTAPVQYPKRPFMAPALRKGVTQLPRFWKNSLK